MWDSLVPDKVSDVSQASPSPLSPSQAANRRTLYLVLGFLGFMAMILWPSFMGQIHYQRTRSELRAIRDAAAGAELASVGKLFTTLARVIGPSVVNVTSKQRIRSLDDEIAAFHGDVPQGIISESVGSGVIVESGGIIITNYHMVANFEEIDVQLADGRRFDGELLGADPASDLAVLKIAAENLPTAEWGDSDSVEVGEMVWAIGNPFGLDRTLTYGIVSGIGRTGVTDNPIQEFLQTDASINPGNSGGPLVDVHGRIMGITTAMVGRDYRGIGFAIPSNTAKNVCQDIRVSGHVERGYLGIDMRPLSPQATRWRGILVAGVEPQSPAAMAGIQPGDVIVGFNGREINEANRLALLLTRALIGNEISLDIVRDNEPKQILVRIGRRPRD